MLTGLIADRVHTAVRRDLAKRPRIGSRRTSADNLHPDRGPRVPGYAIRRSSPGLFRQRRETRVGMPYIEQGPVALCP